MPLAFAACKAKRTPLGSIASLAPGWTGEVIARVPQSYAGWDVEIGDADNDGANEILVTGCPDSQLRMFKKTGGAWKGHLLATNLARGFPGMGLSVRIIDLNGDGKNEIITGTGQERGGPAFFYIFKMNGAEIIERLSINAGGGASSYTHNLAVHDLDKDGVKEIVTAYCTSGQVVRYDTDKEFSTIKRRTLYQVSGSGEASIIADVDNDGKVEYIVSSSYREDGATVEIFEFDDGGELIIPPRIVIDGFEGNKCFYASVLVGDVDNDGKNEMIIGWKRRHKISKSTLLGYRIGKTASIAYTFAKEDESLDLGYFEKMMAIADVDNDGRNELTVSTRGDDANTNTKSDHLGHVFMYSIKRDGTIQRTLLVDFDERFAESSWLAVGDADNDGKNELILATGKGVRTAPGTSYVLLVEKTPTPSH